MTKWRDVATVWAAIETLSGRGWLLSAEYRAGVTTRIRIRWRDEMNDPVTAQWRVMRGTKIYNIDAVLPRYEGMSELHLMCGDGVITEGGQP